MERKSTGGDFVYLPDPGLCTIPAYTPIQNQGGALFVNASRYAAPSLPPPLNLTAPLPGAFVQDCVFQGNGVTGFPAPYYTFSYPFGGGALAVWGRLLVHNSSFLDNAPPPGAEANGSVAHVDGQGVLQLAFCSFAVASAGRQQRLGLRPGDLHLATPHAATRCLGTHVGAGGTAAGVGGAHCFVGPAGGEPWATPVFFLLLGLPVGFAVYLLLLLASPARRWQHHQRRAGPAPWPRGWLVHGSLTAAREEESDDEDEQEGDKASEEARIWSGGYDPAATFPIPPSGSATMWRFLRGRWGPRHRSSSSSAQPFPALLQDGSGASASTLSESEQDSKKSTPQLEEGSEEDSGERTDKEQEGSEGGGNIYSSSSSRGGDGKEDEAEEAATAEAPGSGDSSSGNSSGASGAKKEEEEEDEDVLDWPKTRAYRLSLGAELRDPTKPGELGANHLEPFALEGRGRNVFQVTDPQPLTHSRFGRLYFARNTGVGGQPPCLMLIYNRFKHEAATLVTEKELLHTGSSSTCPFLLRHLDDFFHERVGYYVALTPCCRETLHQRLCRAARAPQRDDPAHAHAHALDFPICVRYLHEILQGLGALRDLRMVHGRLSLNAVLLTPDDHVRLWDYGVPPSAAVRRPDKPTAYSAPEVWDMLRMNPMPVSSMDSWSAGVVGYMLAAKALAVTLPACAPRYRAETYVDYFREYLERQRGGRGGGGGGGGGGHPPSQSQYEPYFPSLPSVDPAFLEEDRRDHGGALVGVLSRLLDVNANRRLPLEAAELEVRQIVQRAVLLARSGSSSGGGGGGTGVVVVVGGGAAAGGGGGDTNNE